MKNAFYILILVINILVFACKKPSNACFTYSPTLINSRTEVSFNASCSENASYFTWSFGDNSSDTTVTAKTISHTFLTPGQFKVTLHAKRKDGISNKKGQPIITQTITVQ